MKNYYKFVTASCFFSFFLLSASHVNAVVVDFYISADDYTKLYINGKLVASYDGYPWGVARATLDLPNGWHDIRLDYANRWGSTHFSFYYKLPSDADYRLVPLAALRSTDSAGNSIPGLRADYLGEGKTFTVYGEGPIQHGWYNLYQGQTSTLWAGQFNANWGVFSETLTGQILIGNDCSGSDLDNDGIEDCLDGGRYPNTPTADPLGVFSSNEFIPQDNDHSNTFNDQNVGGKTTGSVFDNVSTLRAPPFITARDTNFSTVTRSMPDTIVIHHCADNFAGCVSEFRRNSIKSAHYVISKRGEIVQMVNDLYPAYHARYYNDRSIGIELEGWGRPNDYTRAMYESLAGLIATLLEKYPTIPLTFPREKATLNAETGKLTCLNVPGIIGHKQVQPKTGEYDCRPGEILDGKPDPTDNFQWPLLDMLISLKRLELHTAPFITVDNLDTEGVMIAANGGEGGAASIVPFCSIFDISGIWSGVGLASLKLTDGDLIALTCGSLTARVISGPVELLITQDIIITVPSFTSVTVTEGPQDQMEITNLLESEGIVIIEAGQMRSEVAPGERVLQQIPLSIAINIKPDSDVNTINPKSKGKIPVAIISTEGFDATTVNPLSLRFGPSRAAVAHGEGHIEDIDHDGLDDLMLHFDTQTTGIQCGDNSASLIGETFTGQSIEGSDFIKTVGCK